jgi:glycosyltransferase involved in cell wall biosynthesis
MIRFPNHKNFAFSIFDDTDLSTIENVGPIYRLLQELGMRTTKSVWPLASTPGARLGGASLQDPEYRDFVLKLENQGFEIALHNVRNTDSTRREIEYGLEEFRRLIGHYPRVHANHCNNRENVYWGAARFSTIASNLYGIAARATRSRRFEGHIDGSQHFWGDLCKARIDYVRNMVFRPINTLKMNPSMPYHDPNKPLVNAWFSSSDGGDRETFCKLLSEHNQDRLEEEGGVCLVYTHFASGFSNNGRVDQRVEQLLRRLAQKNGWFVPVSQLLDFLRDEHGTLSIPAAEIAGMERRWFREHLAVAAGTMLQLGVPSARSNRSVRSSYPQTRANRVAHVTSAHDSKDVRIFHKECRSLARAGYQVFELATDSGNSYTDGVQIVGIGPKRGRLHRLTAKSFAIAREAIRLKADVYHIHDPELLPLALLLRVLRKRVIYDIHEDLPRTVLYKHYIPVALRRLLMTVVESLENTAARGMSGLIAATPAIAARFKKTNSSIVVVNNFPQITEVFPMEVRPWAERRLSVTYIGGISEERGLDELLAAMPLVAAPEAKLEFAGWFSNPALKDQISSTPEWQNVIWHGLLDRSGVAGLLGSVRAGLTVLHPEKNFLTSQPVKMFEYMAAGIPVIASDFPLWRSMIESIRCGILVDPLDPQAIANAISYLLTHDEEAEAMGKRGRAAIEAHFNWRFEERKLLAFYSSITARTPALHSDAIKAEAADLPVSK